MKDINELLAELDYASEFGYGYRCEGAAEASEAAERIRYLSAELKNAAQVADTLGRHKIILRAALIKIVGAEHPDELNHKKAVLSPISRSEDVRAAVLGIQALLDTM